MSSTSRSAVNGGQSVGHLFTGQPAAVSLLRQVGGRESDAAHVSEALKAYRAAQREQFQPVPPSIERLEQVFAAVSFGSQRVTESHSGSPFAVVARTVDAEPMPPEFLSRSQTAARLGCSVSTVKRRERDGDLVPVRSGRVLRFRVADVDAFLTTNGDSDA